MIGIGSPTGAPEAPRVFSGRRIRLGVGLALAGVPVAVGLFGRFFAGDAERGPAFTLGPEWPLGTDYEGRDVLDQVLHGGASLLTISVFAVVLCYSVAVPWAMTAASTRSRFLDELLMRPLDIIMSVPSLMLLLLIATFTGPSAPVLIITVAILLFPDAVRLLRAEALRSAHGPAMEAMLLMREPWWRRTIAYLGREILPVLAADAGLRFVGAIYLVASASFLGLAADPSTADWSVMVDRNRSGLFLAPWGVVVPAVLIVCLSIGANIISDVVVGARADKRGKR